MSALRSKPGLINQLGRPIGVEFEYSKVVGYQEAVANSINFCYFEHDGTLTEGGKELVVNPASGDWFVKQLAEIINLHEQYLPAVDRSCGYHVHVQSADFTMLTLRRLIAMWCRVERSIFGSLVAGYRQFGRDDGHHYCRPMTVYDEAARVEGWQFTPADVVRLMRKRLVETNEHSTSTPEDRVSALLLRKLYNIIPVEKPLKPIERPIEGTPHFSQRYSEWLNYYSQLQKAERNNKLFEQIKAYKRTNHGAGGCRYATMNVHSHFFRKTIEFRLKEGTLDPLEIIFWPLFCGWFVESATQLTDAEALTLHSLADWVALMRERCIGQPGVLGWVEEKLGKKENK